MLTILINNLTIYWERFNVMKMAAKSVFTVPFNDMANLLTLCSELFNDIPQPFNDIIFE